MMPGDKSITATRNRIFLVRHGENPSNITKEFSNRIVDHGLTNKGVLQAQQTADHLEELQVKAIYSSPLRRATETAGIIAERLALDVVVLEAFREIDVGSLEGRPATVDDWDLHHTIISNWFDGKHNVSFPKGENFFDLWSRFREGLLVAVEGRDGQQILVVGHGGIMSVVLMELCPSIDIAWLRRTHWDNCALAEIDLLRFLGGRLEGTLVKWNQHEHLFGQAADLVPGVPRDS